MIGRRCTVLLLAIAGGAATAGCGTFDDNDAAAVVDGTQLPREDYEGLLQLYTDNSGLTGLSADPATGTVAGEQGRAVLTELVTTMATREFLAANGASITAAERDQARAALADQIGGTEEGEAVLAAPENVLDAILDGQVGQVAQNAAARVEAPDQATLAARYTASPASLGVLCARAIVTETAAEGEAVLAELAAGADFAELAAERSLDPAAADTGGVLEGDGGDCFSLAALTQAGPDFVAAVNASEVGVPIGPLETTGGWFVLLPRPYDEVAESIDALFAERAGELLLSGFLATADISVDPRYGRWDRATNSVVTL